MEGLTPAARLSRFARRALALAADAGLFTAVSLPLLVLLYGPGYLGRPRPSGALAAAGLHGPLDLLLTVVLPLAVITACWARLGATPGKFLLGLKVVDAKSGGPPAWRQAALRAAGYVLSALPLYAGFLWALADREGRALHDRLARTRVVDEPGLERLQLPGHGT